jgi:hypothetical protein
LQYSAAIGDQVLGSSLDSKLEPLFQGCAFEAPRHLGNNATPYWNVENALKFGMASTGRAKTVADHDVRLSPHPLSLVLLFLLSSYLCYHAPKCLIR